jgi:hypothetical protein
MAPVVEIGGRTPESLGFFVSKFCFAPSLFILAHTDVVLV